MIWLRILGVFGWLKNAALSVFDLARRYPWQAAVIALLALFAWTLHGKHRVEQERDQARHEIAAMVEASKQAKAAQIAVNHEPAKQAQAIAEKSNAESPAYYRSVMSAGDANRVHGESICSQHTDLPGTNPPVEGVHGPDPAAEMVSRPKSEDDQLIYAAGRAAEMHQEALDLIARGAAVADPALSQHH